MRIFSVQMRAEKILFLLKISGNEVGKNNTWLIVKNTRHLF